jgi:hypothetical protein
MASNLAKLKIDFLLCIQINEYEKALKIADEILRINKNDQLIKKFWDFLSKHKQ